MTIKRALSLISFGGLKAELYPGGGNYNAESGKLAQCSRPVYCSPASFSSCAFLETMANWGLPITL